MHRINLQKNHRTATAGIQFLFLCSIDVKKVQLEPLGPSLVTVEHDSFAYFWIPVSFSINAIFCEKAQLDDSDSSLVEHIIQSLAKLPERTLGLFYARWKSALPNKSRTS